MNREFPTNFSYSSSTLLPASSLAFPIFPGSFIQFKYFSWFFSFLILHYCIVMLKWVKFKEIYANCEQIIERKRKRRGKWSIKKEGKKMKLFNIFLHSRLSCLNYPQYIFKYLVIHRIVLQVLFLFILLLAFCLTAAYSLTDKWEENFVRMDGWKGTKLQ